MAIKAGRTKKRYKGLDKQPKFVSRTGTLNYQRDCLAMKLKLITSRGIQD
jgi:hypothetical protein